MNYFTSMLSIVQICLFVLCSTIDNVIGLTSEKFKLKYGTNVKSTRSILSTLVAKSKFPCATRCEQTPACGGFNVFQLANQRIQCHLLHGLANALNDIQTENGTSYYERIGTVKLNDCKEYKEYNDPRTFVDIDLDLGGQQTTVSVRCDQTTTGGGWTELIRRVDGSVDFDHLWDTYKVGFGDLNSEFYIGNDVMHAMTSRGVTYELRVDILRFNGGTGYAEYSSLVVDSEADLYRVHIGTFAGGSAGDTFSMQDGAPFTTRDSENSEAPILNCGELMESGFWYTNCGPFSITSKWGENLPEFYVPAISAPFQHGLLWYNWLGFEHPEKMTMMIRPN